MKLRETWERVSAKRQEHQDAAGLKDTAGETRDDHMRAGMEWIDALSAEWDFDRRDFLETLLAATQDTTPNLRALVAIGALAPNDLPEACFGGGFISGLAVGLEWPMRRATTAKGST